MSKTNEPLTTTKCAVCGSNYNYMVYEQCPECPITREQRDTIYATVPTDEFQPNRLQSYEERIAHLAIARLFTSIPKGNHPNQLGNIRLNKVKVEGRPGYFAVAPLRVFVTGIADGKDVS